MIYYRHARKHACIQDTGEEFQKPDSATTASGAGFPIILVARGRMTWALALHMHDL